MKSEENKQDIKWIERVFSKDTKTIEVKYEFYETKKWDKKIKWKDLKYETKNYIYHFQPYETIRSFRKKIYTHKASQSLTKYLILALV